MLDTEPTNESAEQNDLQAAEQASAPPVKRAPRKAAAKRAPRSARSTVTDAQVSDAGASEAPATDGPASAGMTESGVTESGVTDAVAPAKRALRTRKAAAKKAVAPATETALETAIEPLGGSQTGAPAPMATALDGAEEPPAAREGAAADEQAETATQRPKRAPRKRAAKAQAAPVAESAASAGNADEAELAPVAAEPTEPTTRSSRRRAAAAAPVLFQAPSEAASEVVAEPATEAIPSAATEPTPPTTSRRRRGSRRAVEAPAAEANAETGVENPADTDELLDENGDPIVAGEAVAESGADSDTDSDDGEETGGGRRRRRRGRRGRGRGANDVQNDGDSADSDERAAGDHDGDAQSESEAEDDEAEEDHLDEVAEAALSASARRRRRRRRSTGADTEAGSEDDPPNTVVHVRDSRSGGGRGSDADSDGVRGVKGSTRLEAKRQRRRDNRDSGRRRAPILTEAEFLARREAVDRVMAIRQTGDRTQIAVLEDDILVEHYVTRASASSAVGNVYLGRVQNVLPSMEAAFVDIGRGRNGVLYAGEVNWDAAGLEGKARAIEHAMSSGDTVLVQVTKDPIGHKGARLTSQISLPGRFVVYVPGGGMTGISRKLPDTERSRLKAILKKVVPDDAGVIVRTAAEGASEQDLISDVERLKSQWDAIQTKAAQPGNAPTLVYGEPDLAIRVVRDVFNDDFSKLVVSGSQMYATLTDYVGDVAPDLRERIHLHTGESDVFGDLRVDEQLAKALDRKVYLPSGGSLVIDRTEAMVVIDVNTGKYTGSGGNLEQTVTRNNLEAAEEIVRQLRLRDVGGIVVIDFIDMVLESNRDLVLRRLTECLGRDRTKHQVAEVTSLGLVQMTRKRVGEGLLEAFSEPCEHCRGRGVIVHTDPVDRKHTSTPVVEEDKPARGRRTRKAKSGGDAPVEVPVVDEEKRRVAASAIAAIAAATAHHDDQGTVLAEAGLDEHAVTPEITDAVSTAIAAVAAAQNGSRSHRDAPSVGEGASQPVSGRGAESEAGPHDDGPTGVAADAAVLTTGTARVTSAAPRPRRRRGASRPAGPPAAVVGAHDSSGE